MSTISKTKTWADNENVTYSDLNANFDTIYNDYNGSITNANISGSAAIAASKLALSTVYTRSVISLSTNEIWVATGKDEFTVPANIGSGKWVMETVEVETDIAPSSGKTLTVDVNKGGTTILSAPIAVADTAILSTGNTPSVTALSAGDRLTLDIDVATSGTATTRVRVNIVVKQFLT